MQIDEALYVRERLLHPLRLGAQDGEIGSIDAHDDGFALPGQHLPDPLFQIGLNVTIDAWGSPRPFPEWPPSVVS